MHCACAILAIWSPVASIARGVGVADVEPHGSIRAKDAPQFGEGLDDAADVRTKAVVTANLVRYLIVPQGPIGRRGHYGLNGFRRQQAKRSPRVPADQQRSQNCVDARRGIRQAEVGGRWQLARRADIARENALVVHCGGLPLGGRRRATHLGSEAFGQPTGDEPVSVRKDWLIHDAQ